MPKNKYFAIIFILILLLVMLSNCKKTTEPDTQKVATPAFSPASGTYSGEQSVSITCTTNGANIRYTIDGSDPTASSAAYSNPILVSSTTTIKAKGFKEGWTPSSTASVSYTIDSSPAQMAFVPSGTFMMGDTRFGVSETALPIHSVTLNSFYMSKYQVTQADYAAVMGSNPASGNGVGDNNPVYYVSWYSAIEYCNLCSLEEGLTPVYTINGSTNPNAWGVLNFAVWDAVLCNWSANGYRLPTEAEFEYAARGAATTPDYLYSGSDEIDAVAWYEVNSDYVHPVGTKAPNALGIYDMSGNIFEWVWDWWDRNYYSTNPPSNNPIGPSSGTKRAIRGGFFEASDLECRVWFRHGGFHPGTEAYYNGFRVCRSGL